MKAQASLEQLFMVGLALVVLAAAFVISTNYLSDSAKISQAQDAVSRLASAADYVSSLGANSKETVSVYLPTDIISTNVTGNNIILTVGTSSGPTSVFATSKATVIGALPGNGAGQIILVQALPSGKVLIGQAGITCNPNSLTKILAAGGSGSDVILIGNVADYNVTGINATLSGGSGLLSLGAVSSSSLTPGQNGTLTVSYTIPGGQAPGTYSGMVTFNSSSGDTCSVQIAVSVTGVQTCSSLCKTENYQNGTCRANSSVCANNSEDFHPENGGGCAGGTPSCCCGPTTIVFCNVVNGSNSSNNTGNGTLNDTFGPLVITMSHSNTSGIINSNVTEFATGSDLTTGGSNLSVCYARIDGGSWATGTPSGGTWAAVTVPFNFSVGLLTVGEHTVSAYCNDSHGNNGPISNDTFFVSAGDVMLVIDVSGSMSDPITNALNGSFFSTTSTSFTDLENVSSSIINGQTANVSLQYKSSKNTCRAFYELRIGNIVVSSGNTTSTSYQTVTVTNYNISSYSAPVEFDLWAKINSSACSVSAGNMAFTQLPTKMTAAIIAATQFVSSMANSSTYAGLVTFSDSATTVKTLAAMNVSTNLNNLKTSIGAMTPGGSTCIECGIDNGNAEETSVRSRYPNSNRVIVLESDGQSNIGNSYTAADISRTDNITVYTIGLGNGADATELTDDALLTYGNYHFAPDQATLQYIYAHIGQP